MRARLVTVCVLLGTGAALFPGQASAAGSFTLSTTNPNSPRYAPTFTGNGLLGVRVPATGQGYAGGTVPAQSELAGFYAKPSTGKASNQVQQRANIPTWSTLTFADGGATFSPRVVTPSAGGSRSTCTPGSSRPARLDGARRPRDRSRYQVFTDRAREHVGVVQLTLTPQWTGTAT